MDSAEGIALQVKYEWAERRREEAEMLTVSLRSSMMTLLDEISTLSDRCTTLKNVQEIIIAERNSADATIERILKEKANLAAENASLRVNQKDLRRAMESLSSVDSIISHITSKNTGEESESNSQDEELKRTKSELLASRLILAKVLGIVRRNGVHVSIEDLTTDVSEVIDMNGEARLDMNQLILQEAQLHIPPTPISQPATRRENEDTSIETSQQGITNDTKKAIAFSDSDPSTDCEVSEETSVQQSLETNLDISRSVSPVPNTTTANAHPLTPRPSENTPESTSSETAPKGLFSGLWSVLVGAHDTIPADAIPIE